MRHTLAVVARVAGVAFLLGSSRLPAQKLVGTAKATMTMKVPAAAAAIAGGMGIDSLHGNITAASDGQRALMDMAITGGPTGEVHMKMVFDGDSLHMAIMLPAGSPMPGFRIDALMSDIGALGNPLMASMADSVSKSMGTPAFRNLNSSAIVAGLQCEQWQMTTATDTTDLCVVPTPPALDAYQARMKSGLGQVLGQLGGMADLQKAAFGGRSMYPIRTHSHTQGASMELTSVSGAAPDAAMFVLPTDLMPMPLPGKGGGGR